MNIYITKLTLCILVIFFYLNQSRFLNLIKNVKKKKSNKAI